MTIVAIFAELFVRMNFIVPDDATKTAQNIMDNELLFRMAIAGQYNIKSSPARHHPVGRRQS